MAAHVEAMVGFQDAGAGKAPKETGDLLHAITLGLFQRAHGFIRSS
jgi:hypothetical protein